MKNTAGEAQVAGAQSPQERPTAKRSEEKRDSPHHWVQCINSLPGDKAQLHGPWQLSVVQGARRGS